MAMPTSAAPLCCATADGAHDRERTATASNAAGGLDGDEAILRNLFIFPS